MYSHSFGLPTTTFIYSEIKYLHQNGHEIHYLCNHYFENDFENFCIVYHVPLVESIIWKSLNGFFGKILSSLKISFLKENSAELLNKIQPDIIHCHFIYEGIRLYQNLPIKLLLSPLIFHVHGYGGSQMLKKKSYISEIDKILKYPHVGLLLFQIQ